MLEILLNALHFRSEIFLLSRDSAKKKKKITLSKYKHLRINVPSFATHVVCTASSKFISGLCYKIEVSISHGLTNAPRDHLFSLRSIFGKKLVPIAIKIRKSQSFSPDRPISFYSLKLVFLTQFNYKRKIRN